MNSSMVEFQSGDLVTPRMIKVGIEALKDFDISDSDEGLAQIAYLVYRSMQFASLPTLEELFHQNPHN